MLKPNPISGPCLPLAITLTLSGCTVLGPHYHRPDIPPPQAWTATTAQNSAPASGASASISPTADAAAMVIPDRWPARDWWAGFKSPELDELMRQAEAANDDLAAAMARVQQADAQVRIAGAPLLPSLQAEAIPQRSRQFLAISSTPSTVTYNSFTAQLAASYQLDFWGRNYDLRQAAVASARASRFDRETVRLTVLSSVATTYFTALTLRERIEIAERDLAAARQTLDGLKLERSVGTATALDVAQQETVVNTEDATIPALRAQLQQNVTALAILTGRRPEELTRLTGQLADLGAPEVVAGLPSQLLARRPDVANAESQLIAANANVAAARAAFFPSINLTASGGFESAALSTLVSPATRIMSIGADLVQPIFQGGALKGQYQLNKARYTELLADYHKAVISAFGNVETALTQVQETREQQRRQQLAAQTASQANDFAQKQFHAGTVNILNVLNTETSMLTTEDTLAQVKLAHLTALVSLYQALGGGWEAKQEP